MSSSLWFPGLQPSPLCREDLQTLRKGKAALKIQTPSRYSFLICQVIGSFSPCNNWGEEAVCLWLHLKSHRGNTFSSLHQIKIHEKTECAKRIFFDKAEVGAPFLDHNSATKACNLLSLFL